MLNLDQEVFLKGTIVGMEKDREGKMKYFVEVEDRRFDRPERITAYKSDLINRIGDFVNE